VVLQGREGEAQSFFFSVDNHWLAAAARELAPQVQWFEGVRACASRSPPTDSPSTVPEIGARDRAALDPTSVREPEPFSPWSGTRNVPADRLRKVRDFIVGELGEFGAHART
jgi:hypothetical protein